jgi:hypothetical protein
VPELAALSPQIIGLTGIPTLPKNFFADTAITPVRLLIEQGGEHRVVHSMVSPNPAPPALLIKPQSRTTIWHIMTIHRLAAPAS